jgi:hypothetical protein
VSVQVPVPEQSPLQPAKLEPPVGVAVSVTLVGAVNAAEQLAPQLIAAGALVTVPLPAPALVTVSVWLVVVGGTLLKVAPTARAWSSVT